MRGMIANINYGRGCGFIQPDGDEVACKELYFGDAVTFELQEEVSEPAQLRAMTVARLGE